LWDLWCLQDALVTQQRNKRLHLHREVVFEVGAGFGAPFIIRVAPAPVFFAPTVEYTHGDIVHLLCECLCGQISAPCAPPWGRECNGNAPFLVIQRKADVLTVYFDSMIWRRGIEIQACVFQSGADDA